MLRELQKERIFNFLKINDPSPWKILILDKRTQEILGPLVKVNELREINITAHFLIDTKRNQIKNIPAIYFVDATDKNIETIINDVENNLYSSYYLNFLNYVTVINLEKIAQKLGDKGKGLYIRKVFDQFLDFLTLQNNVFSMNYYDTFIDPLSSDKIVNSLFGVFLSLKEPPFIVYDDACEEIAEKLNLKIKNSTLIKDTRKKPLLILLDREFDLKTPIEHVWTYASLIDDLLTYKSNRVTLPSNESFDLDPSDEFWIKNKEEFFPEVAERVEKELTEYKKEMALRCVDEKSDQKQIEETLEKAPELAKKKASLHAHMTICLSLVELIKKRSIDDFYRIEKSVYKKKDILEISEKGNNDDIIRLCISMLKNDNLNIVEAILNTRKIDTSILKHFKGKDFLELKAGTFYKQAVSNLMGSVKKLLPISTTSPLSNQLEKIYNGIKNQNFLDIKMKIPFGNHCFEKEISKVVVFCVRGGCFTEIKSVNDWSKKNNLEVVYGTTEIVNGERILDQIKRIKD